jgi:hypothetical protein
MTLGDGPRTLKLVSGGVNCATAGTPVTLQWDYRFLGGKVGGYTASNGVLQVDPRDALDISAGCAHLAERLRWSGEVGKTARVILAGESGSFRGHFDWASTTNNPTQELAIELTTKDGSVLWLMDPISLRFNFLISLHD